MIRNKDLKIERLQELLNDVTSRKPVQQAIVAVESGDQTFRWVGVRGAQVREETPFFIASIDKLYNAVLLMILYEKEELKLEDPITAYLPDTITRGLHRLNGVDYSDNITIRHLLSHSSGLPDWLEDYPRKGTSLMERIIAEGDRSFTLEEVASLVRDQLAPHFPPQDLTAKRQKVRYSDINFILLIAIIEAVTGQPLHQVHKLLLYEPLNLRHTYFSGFSEPMEAASDSMPLYANGKPLDVPLIIQSVRGVNSTAMDTLSFLRRFARNEIFEKPETRALMLERWNRFGFPTDRAALRSPSWPIEYGLGIMRFQLPRLFTPFQPMPAVLGHSGSTGCWLFWCPDMDLFLAGCVNEVAAGTVPYRVMPKILKILSS